jgi:RimJ/RimL family protein N-acetyltransferase
MQSPPPFNIQLKDGKVVTIRAAVVADAEKLLNTIKEYVPESEFIPKLENELTMTTKQCEDWIASFIQYDNSLLLVAENNNKIIGNIDLTGNRRKVMEHTAVIGMGILSQFRNSGLGTAFITAIINWSKANPILELIWLQVYSQNELALGLYRKMGFVENGVTPGFFKHKNRYYDNLTMSMSVK